MELKDKIALVTGASRGAGRGIAIELAIAGAKVYITGRSRTNSSTTQYDTNTLDYTAQIIKNKGGIAIPITCDHTNVEQIHGVFSIIQKEVSKLDILVNNAWAGYMGEHGQLDNTNFMAKFWEQPLWSYDLMLNVSLRGHFIASQLAAKMMINQMSGLIANTSFWDGYKYLSNLGYDVVKTAINRMPFGMAIELQPYNVTAVTLSLGWIRTEHIKHLYKIDDYNYRNNEELKMTESTRYAGRAIVALASDPKVMDKTGKIVVTGELAREYGFTDLDGTQPTRFVIPDVSKDITMR